MGHGERYALGKNILHGIDLSTHPYNLKKLDTEENGLNIEI